MGAASVFTSESVKVTPPMTDLNDPTHQIFNALLAKIKIYNN